MAPAPLLVIPPLSCSLSGPPAAVGALAGAAPDLEVLDVNALWIRSHQSGSGLARSVGLVGDHAKPAGGFRAAADAWEEAVCAAVDSTTDAAGDGRRRTRHLWVEHAVMEQAIAALRTEAPGRFVELVLPSERPSLVAISIMFPDQVVGALLVVAAARRRWPGVTVVLGGAHVTALGAQVASDPRIAIWGDVWVTGYAEHTFAELCRAAQTGRTLADPAGPRIIPGVEAAVPWRFPDLSLYGSPTLTLPAQASRGCAYGRCAFCTYPAVEGRPRRRPINAVVGPVIEEAVRLGADVALRDALALPDTIDAVAAMVAGRARFSACTRLRPRLGRERLRRWAEAGLRTIEVGVESVDDATLRAIDKRQRLEDVEALLCDAADLPIHLVLNVMFGWPGQSEEQALRDLGWFEEVLPSRYPRTRFSTERNMLQVERLSPMGRDPERFGICVTATFPWATAVCWNEPPWRSRLEHRLAGHHDLEARP